MTEKPKRILIFSLIYNPASMGGAEIAIKEITDRIPPSEMEFHLLALRFDSRLPKREKIGNILVHRIGLSVHNPSPAQLKKFPLYHVNKYLFYQGLGPFYALALHFKYHYDGIWAMMAHSVGIAAALFKLMVPKIKYVLTLQEGDPPEYIEKLARPAWPIFKRAFTSADRVQVISSFLGKWATRMGYPGTPILIPNAVDIGRFTKRYSLDELAELTKALGKKKGDVFLVTTSRLVHKNAVDDVIKAVTLLPKRVHFLVLGIGPDENMLKDLARREGVAERVKFIGQIGHAELPKYLAISDIFIRPSRSEGMGNSFVEAFAAGIPVIATQEGGLADFLYDAKRNPDKPTTGWAVRKDSPEDIARAVNDILSHPEEVERIKENARALAVANYDWNNVAKKMQGLAFSIF